jgi:hypothetical protein
MFLPDILARIEEGDHDPTLGVDAREIRTFVAVAVDAGEGEVFRGIATQVLPCPDVLDVVTGLRILLGERAILATFPGPPSDQGACGGVHQFAAWLAR